jgi:uncharacterized RDD family membrane protein YckC
MDFWKIVLNFIRQILIHMDKITIKTPEHIELEYELAGLGSRYVSLFIDHLIQFFVLSLLFLALVISHPNFTAQSPAELMRSVFAGVMMVFIFMVSFGYFIFFETIWSGQTPGKKYAQIQVIKDNGEPIGFIDALLRNMFRMVDFFPFYYYLGAGFIWFHKDRKRIGDIVAHTIVVRHKANLNPVSLPELNGKSDLQMNVSLIKEQEYALVRDFIISRHSLQTEDRIRIAQKLANLIRKKLSAEDIDVDNEEFIETVAVQYRRFKKAI